MKLEKVFAVEVKHTGILNALDRLVNFLSFPKQASRIAIKLNLCDYRQPETGAVSDPAVVGALLCVLRNLYPKSEIFLCENDSSDTLVSNMWGYLGFDEVIKVYNAKCVSLSEDAWFPVSIPGLHFKEIEIPRLLHEADLIINHPKLKTHGKTKITCGLKNLFGCYRQKNKGPLHAFLSHAIADINLAIRPQFTIVDANLCVEGNRGPTQGLPKQVGLFIGGRDPVAVDTFCARLMGFRPSRIEHITAARKIGVGQMQYSLEGDLVGDDLRTYRFQYSELKFILMQLIRRVFSWSDAA